MRKAQVQRENRVSRPTVRCHLVLNVGAIESMPELFSDRCDQISLLQKVQCAKLQCDGSARV